MTIRRVLLIIGVLFVILFRFYDLGARPIHHDEAVNGWFVDGLFRNGYYTYDPHNYHGPIYFYFLALAEALFGRSVEVLRSVSLFFGALLVWIPFLYRRWIGEKAAWIATYALALSPAVIFYSRYAIHEVPFALASALFVYFWLRTREEAFDWKKMIGLGLSLGFAASLKENFVIVIGCLLIAEVMVRVYEKNWSFPDRYYWNLASVLVFFGVIALVFSALGRDENGVSNFFAAFNLWSETGSQGNGHGKPFYYWLKVFADLEWPALVGLVISPLALAKVPSAFRLLSVTTVGVFLAYSIVNYKTPWCHLSFHWGLILIFAYWIAGFSRKSKWLAGILLAILAVHSGVRAYQAAYLDVDADDNLYVYGQTYRDLMSPLKEILNRVENHPELKSTLQISVISQFTWPLPYLLGEIKKTAYFTDKNVPPQILGDYVLIDENLESMFANRLVGNYTRNVYRARQWASRMAIYTRQP